LSKYCSQKSLYIGVDISFTALELNRARNTHRNSLYVLCSSDYELPFQNESADVLCYFGILHHTKNKSNNIEKDKRVLRKDGYFILSESIDRPILSKSRLVSRVESSAHEEHISKNKLLSQLDKESKIVFCREEGTPFFTVIMALFRNAMLNNRRLFIFTLNLDIFIVMTVGKILPFFKAGEILLLARKHRHEIENTEENEKK
jgi:SAM-dependent methyltransferase